jgi:hypothetical protein
MISGEIQVCGIDYVPPVTRGQPIPARFLDVPVTSSTSLPTSESEHCHRTVSLLAVFDDDADALKRVAGSLQEFHAALAELDGVAVGHGAVREGGAGSLGQLLVAGDEAGVQVGLDDVFEAQAKLGSGVKIDLDVALGVDNGGDSFRPNQIRCVCQTTQIELFKNQATPRKKCIRGASLHRIG